MGTAQKSLQTTILFANSEAEALSGYKRAKLEGAGSPFVELLALSGLCPSKGQARKDLEGGGIYINNVREGNHQRTLRLEELLFGKHLLLRKGKRNYVVLEAQ